MINKIIKILFIQQIFINYVFSHSWITCTDYQLPDNYPKIINNINTNTGNSNGNNTYNLLPLLYNIDSCNGFTRNYNLQYQSDINRGFGFDTGYEHRNQQCKYSYTNNEKLKIARYKSGSTICLTYPSKNHVASECTNKNILDNGVKIYRSVNKLTDDFTNEIKHLNNHHIKDTIDYQGFQNCPGFCNNPDKSVCYMCFNLESNIDNGIYSFKWIWEFNPGEFYSSCWDANIINDNNITDESDEYRGLQLNNFKYSKNAICSNVQPTNAPNVQLTNAPNVQPTNAPNVQPTNAPNVQPTNAPNVQPTNKKCTITTNNDQSNPTNNDQSINIAHVWSQCGGVNYENKNCKNSECIKFSPYYSQCLPNILDEKALCGQNDNKEINWIYNKCKSGYSCKKYNSVDFRCL